MCRDIGNLVRVRAVVLASIISIAGGCTCEKELVNERTSPDGRYIATVLERSCGVTSDYVTAINVRERRDPFEGDPADDVLRIWGLPPLEIQWEGPRQLVIGLPELRGKESVYAQEASWRDVAITYRHIERSSMTVK